jgi:hypothetical protein
MKERHIAELNTVHTSQSRQASDPQINIYILYNIKNSFYGVVTNQ